MDWEKIYRERNQKHEKERTRLLSMSDAEASKLDTSEQYQRMRYQREIEAAEWLEKIRREIKPAQPEKTDQFKKRYARKGRYDKWSD